MIMEEIDCYTKEGIAILVTKQIYNMAPEKCSSCAKTYYLKPDKYCVLSCFRYNRGCWRDCYEKEKEKLQSIMMFRKAFSSLAPCALIHLKARQCPREFQKEVY